MADEFTRALLDQTYAPKTQEQASPGLISQLEQYLRRRQEKLPAYAGTGEALATGLSALGSMVPAGLAGLGELARSRDVGKAAERVEDVQGALTYLPRSKPGIRALEAAARVLEPLSIPSEKIGEYTLEKTGSPGAATAASIALDPINLLTPGVAKAGLKGLKAAPRVTAEMLEQALFPSYVPGGKEAQRGAIKMKGGNWLAGDVEGATERLKTAEGDYVRNRIQAIRQRGIEPTAEDLRQLELAPQTDALNNWIDKKLNRYIKNEMGTPEDPVRKLAEQGILHAEPNIGRVDEVNAQMHRSSTRGQKLAQSPLADKWEDFADAAIDPLTADVVSSTHMLANNPWLAKLNPSDPVFVPRESVLNRGGFDHLIDELKNAIRPDSDLPERLRWKPEDLDKVTMEQAVRRVHDINEYRAAKKAEANEVLASNPATVTFKEYPTVPGSDAPNTKGLVWKEIKPVAMPQDYVLPERYSIVTFTPGASTMAIKDNQTGKYITTGLESLEQARKHLFDTLNKQQLQDALKYEGDVMGHCVGGYCDDVLSGRSQIYSLRDKKGEPHVTIEVERGAEVPLRPEDNPPADIYSEMNKWMESGGYKSPLTFAQHWRAMQGIPEPKTELQITQIKGKGNLKPKEEYLPFVQDFVRGGNWSHIGDWANTGLKNIKNYASEIRDAAQKTYPNQRYFTADELKPILDAFDAKKMKSGGSVHMADGGAAVIPDMTDGGRVIDGGAFKNGGQVKGKVHISDNPDTMALELAGGGGRLGKAAKAAAEAASKLAAKEAEEAPAFTAKQLQSTADKIAAKVKEEKPNLSDDEVMKRALRMAEQKLKWERVEKPGLEKTYGELERAKYSEPLARRQRNVPEVVQKRIQETQEFLKQPTEPWTPPRKELQAFERERIKEALEGFPGVEQTKFPRYQPPRSDLSYIDEIYGDPVNRELIKGQIQRGLPLGGETFYASLYPMKLAALERGIPEEKFNQFIYSTAPASARNSIMNEMAVGQFMRDMKARGLPLDEDTVKQEMAAFKAKYGTGLPLMPVHREGVKNVLEGGQDLREMLKADIPTNYKIPTYGTQKAGDFGKSMVLDVHESAGQTRGSRYHPYFTEQGGFGPAEYGAAENKMLGIANEMGIPGGMAQAGRWFGGGELTGLKSPRGDALDLLERQTAYTLQGLGVNPTPRNVRNYLLDMIETGQGVLMPWFKKEGMPDVRTEKKKGGAVKKPKGKKVEISDNLDTMRLAIQKRK